MTCSFSSTALAARSAGVVWMLLSRWLGAVLLTLFVAGCTSLPENVGRTTSTAFAAPEQTALGRLVHERREASQTRSDSGFVLLDSVDAAFAGRLALIDSAERSLDLQYYAVHADSSTETLLQRLREAARRGVRVRILLDDLNTVGKDAQVLRLAFEPNVEIRLFNPLTGSRSSLVGRLFTSLKDIGRLQKRMHNKMFISDNVLGIAGGRNLGDAYFGTDKNSNFVDLDVLAAGRIVRDMSASFDRYWNDELAYPVQSLVSREDLEKLRPSAQGSPARPDTPPTPPVPVPTPTGSILPSITSTAVVDTQLPVMHLDKLPLVWAPSLLMADQPGKIGPDDDEADAGETVVDGLLHLVEQARQDVLVVSPYFVPGPAMMALFRQLQGKGVRIRVLTNSLASNDAPAAHAGYARHRKDLLAAGVELHEMRATQEGSVGGLGSGGGFGSSAGAGSEGGTSRASLHSKAVIIDGRLSVIGSMNLDLRSQRQNSEVALLIRSATIAKRAIGQVEAMLTQGAYRVRLENGQLAWEAPAGAAFQSTRSEPEASAKLRLLVQLIAPFAPDEML